ncbi:TetR/AcrR family transcriptional regulator [Gordonibacter pamelaeae]|uniref:TetR/AcrR family transcriptional regulator n=1 Tax=Gordonibacter pamelaeae TaxID=471189 RepID=UPI0039F5006D
MENQRVRLSKALLKEALVRLLETKPLDKITIYELCAEAQINRTTFYKYYGSQGDVLKDIENELFAMLETHLVESVKGDEESLASVLRCLDMEQRKFLVLVNATPDQQFSERFTPISMPACSATAATTRGSTSACFCAKAATPSCARG